MNQITIHNMLLDNDGTTVSVKSVEEDEILFNMTQPNGCKCTLFARTYNFTYDGCAYEDVIVLDGGRWGIRQYIAGSPKWGEWFEGIGPSPEEFVRLREEAKAKVAARRRAPLTHRMSFPTI